MVNTDEPELALYRAERRILKIQSKLHRWARSDARRLAGGGAEADATLHRATGPDAAPRLVQTDQIKHVINALVCMCRERRFYRSSGVGCEVHRRAGETGTAGVRVIGRSGPWV